MIISVDIGQIAALVPPFDWEEDPTPAPTPSNVVIGDLSLETPEVLLTGSYLNAITGQVVNYNNRSIQYSVLKEDSITIRNRRRLVFIGEVTVNFSSIYPLKTYSEVMKKDRWFTGEEKYGYQQDRAEIRYTLDGSRVFPNSTLYKESIVIKRDTAGANNIILKYKLFYEGRKSKIGQVNFSIIKGNDKVFRNWE